MGVAPPAVGAAPPAVGSKPAAMDIMPAAARGPVVCPAALPQERPPASPSPAAKHYDRNHGLLWEAGYHDRILSDKGQLQTLIDYIHDNPRRLLVKRSAATLFRVQDVTLAGTAMQAVGNLSLLRHPRRMAVRISRRLTDDEVRQEVERCLTAARGGTLLISPFISRGERAVRDAAAAEALPMVHLQENGFPPFFKPSRAAFEAVAAGRLLLLAPWPYHTRNTAITRQQCNTLNVLAVQLAAQEDGIAPQQRPPSA